MNASEFGPFTTVVGLALALVATFSMLVLKAFGTVKRWSWLTDDSPPFLVAAGPRTLAVGLMALTYVTINATNYWWFSIAAVLVGGLCLVWIARFDHLRKLHVHKVPEVGRDGTQLTDGRGRPVHSNIVIGLESNMRENVKQDLADARQRKGGLSLGQFMSGYGASKMNDPEALWDRAILAKASNSLTLSLIGIFLSGVMALFWAAFSMEAFGARQ